MASSWVRDGFWLEGRDRFADDLQDRFAVLVAQLVIRGKALADLSRDVRRRLSQSLLGIPHLVDRHAVQDTAGQRHRG